MEKWRIRERERVRGNIRESKEHPSDINIPLISDISI